MPIDHACVPTTYLVFSYRGGRFTNPGCVAAISQAWGQESGPAFRDVTRITSPLRRDLKSRPTHSIPAITRLRELQVNASFRLRGTHRSWPRPEVWVPTTWRTSSRMMPPSKRQPGYIAKKSGREREALYSDRSLSILLCKTYREQHRFHVVTWSGLRRDLLLFYRSSAVRGQPRR